jgi:hypothetical protein
MPPTRARAHGQTTGGDEESSNHIAADRAGRSKASTIVASYKCPSLARARTSDVRAFVVTASAVATIASVATRH